MRLRFVYAPVAELAEAEAFYGEELGLARAWREGDDTVAFDLPHSDVQVMVSTSPEPAGPMYLVDSVADFLAQRPHVAVAVPVFDIPDGQVVGLRDPGGNVFYVFDQAGVQG
jgi:extradiol dioxygenase family protein